jgi:hypothetical protein
VHVTPAGLLCLDLATLPECSAFQVLIYRVGSWSYLPALNKTVTSCKTSLFAQSISNTEK